MHEQPTTRRRSPVLLGTVAVALWCMAAGAWARSQFDQPLPRSVMVMRVDVNHADSATLELLPGIGPKLAAQIVAQRQVKPFTRAEELTRISGIGMTIMQRVKPMICFDQRGDGSGDRQ